LKRCNYFNLKNHFQS